MSTYSNEYYCFLDIASEDADFGRERSAVAEGA